MSNRIQSLASVVDQLAPRDQAFARDLLATFNRRGDLSPRQWPWVDTLAQRATQPQAPRVSESVGDFAGAVALFATAKAHLKFPKIRLQIGEKVALPVVLSLAGERSKYPGTVQVTDGGAYGSNTWFGRVDAAGNWTPGTRVDASDLAAVRALLQDFSKAPAETAKRHGRLTGRCCFCNLPLKDERSTAAGFGPVCAENYGLASEWKAATAVLDQPLAA